MTDPRLFLLLAFTFAGTLLYMIVTRDFSPPICWSVGGLGLLLLVVSWYYGRRNLVAVAQLWTIVSATVEIFALVAWWYSRIRVAGLIALATAPIALTFALLSLRRR